jgi:hypothetical protein
MEFHDQTLEKLNISGEEAGFHHRGYRGQGENQGQTGPPKQVIARLKWGASILSML